MAAHSKLEVEKKRMAFVQEFRDKRMMGHTFQRCDLKIKAK
jgi:hypothetical protein